MPESKVKCPTCADDFSSEKGMKIHHKKIHAESIAGEMVECGSCGVGFSKKPVLVEKDNHHFCCNSCRTEWKAHSDDELLGELTRLQEELGRTPSQTHLKKRGQFNKKAYKRAFGGWNDALRQAGMDPNREDYTKKECLNDILATVQEVNHPPKMREHKDHGAISPQCIRKKFGSWVRAISESGLDPTEVREYDISKEDLLAEVESVADQIDDVPTKEEMTKFGKYAAGTVQHQFGTWQDALRQAGFELNRKPTVTVDCSNCGEETEKIQQHVKGADHNFCKQKCHYDWLRDGNAPSGAEHHQFKPESGQRAKYGPNWPHQRKKARKRDNHRCQRCKMSSSEHKNKYGMELHVHHITPWHCFDDHTKRNSLSNLITLCASCHKKWENIPVQPQIKGADA